MTGVPRALLGIVTGVPRVLLGTIMDGCASYTLHEFDDLRGAQLIQTLLILPRPPPYTHFFCEPGSPRLPSDSQPQGSLLVNSFTDQGAWNWLSLLGVEKFDRLSDQ